MIWSSKRSGGVKAIAIILLQILLCLGQRCLFALTLRYNGVQVFLGVIPSRSTLQCQNLLKISFGRLESSGVHVTFCLLPPLFFLLPQLAESMVLHCAADRPFLALNLGGQRAIQRIHRLE